MFRKAARPLSNHPNDRQAEVLYGKSADGKDTISVNLRPLFAGNPAYTNPKVLRDIATDLLQAAQYLENRNDEEISEEEANKWLTDVEYDLYHNRGDSYVINGMSGAQIAVISDHAPRMAKVLRRLLDLVTDEENPGPYALNQDYATAIRDSGRREGIEYMISKILNAFLSKDKNGGVSKY